MIGKREEVPYDEDGKQLSFSTDAETVYVDGIPLKTWLSRLESKLTNIALGKDGNSFYGFLTDYASVSDANNNIDSVKQILSWSPTSPALTPEVPHLWKRVQSKAQDSTGAIFVTNIDYEYCGSLGQVGMDAEWKEWIFRLTSNDRPEEEIAGILLVDLDSYYNSDKSSDFLQNDFIPPLWLDDMQTVSDEKTIQWCASRYKKNGLWSKFSNVHVFGRKPLDAVTINNIYTVSPEIENDKWNSDKDKLINSITLDRDSGTIKNFPAGTNYTWVDFVPNTKSSEIIFQASAYFLGSTCINIDSPIRITGPAGVGSDGAGIEFAYCTADSEDNVEGLPEFFASEKHFESQGGWYDTAGECPISPTNPYQFMRQRLGQYNNDNDWYWQYDGKKYGKSPSVNPEILDISQAPVNWNYGWSEPMLWSSWGTDGIDGDGVQYVYVLLTEAEYQFVSKDKNRWNFDGGFSDSDPGDINDPNNPNNPDNCTYSYRLNSESYTLGELIGATATTAIVPGISGYYTITNGNGEVLEEDIPFELEPIIVTLDTSNFNLDQDKTKECNLRITYSGSALPGNGDITFTLYFTRNKAPYDNSTYTVFYLVGTPGNNPEYIPQELCPNGNNPNTVLWSGLDTEISAPVIIGYTANEPTEATVTGGNTVISFYYTKN